VGEAGVAADLRAEVDAELAPDHLRALQLDQVLEPLINGLPLADRLVELAHPHHHLRLVRPDLHRLDPAAGLRLAAGQLLHHPRSEPVDELDHRPGVALRYSLDACHRAPPVTVVGVRGSMSYDPRDPDGVTAMDERQLANKFERQRPRLRAVAYRILGSLSEADDAVQEAWLRLSRTDADQIDSLEPWLTTV